MPLPTRANRAFFDLAHLDTLSGEPGHCLFVSPKTLYVLQNLVAADILDLTRYAVTMLDCGWYIPCKKWSSEYAQVAEIQESIEREVVEMSIYGYTDTIIDREYEASPGIGTQNRDFIIPEGELWEVQAITATNSSRVFSLSFYSFNEAGNEWCRLLKAEDIEADTFVFWAGKIILKGGQKIRVAFEYCEVGDGLKREMHAAKLNAL